MTIKCQCKNYDLDTATVSEEEEEQEEQEEQDDKVSVFITYNQTIYSISHPGGAVGSQLTVPTPDPSQCLSQRHWPENEPIIYVLMAGETGAARSKVRTNHGNRNALLNVRF